MTSYLQQSVSNTTKILKRKQITTKVQKVAFNAECFQYDKDTKKKANHNYTYKASVIHRVFPIRQRY